jgi:conjugative transfer pilus assembly protein TraH
VSKRIVAIFIIICMFVTPVYAGWVDRWISSHISTSPSSYQSQQRGYFTAGSFSARWPQGNDQLFAVNSPKINAGCGGIDILGGGISFLMNPEYLVQKLQQILSAAAAAAFDIALKVLCEPCAETIKSLEQISELLNSLQLDTCAMGKNLTVEIMSPLSPEKMSKMKADSDAYFSAIGSRLTSFYEWLTRVDNTRGGEPQSGTDPIKESMKGCSSEVKSLMSNFSPGSFLSNVGSGKFDSDLIDIIRGVLGDVRIETKRNNNGSDELVTVYRSNCLDNNMFKADDLIDGRYKAMNSSGACYSTTTSIRDYAEQRVVRIIQGLKNKSSIDSDTSIFIQRMPAPLYMAIKTAVATGADDIAKPQLVDMIARELAYHMITDIYSGAVGLANKAKEAATKAGHSEYGCNTKLIEGMANLVTELALNARNYEQAIRDENAKTYQSILTIMELSRRYEEWHRQFQKEVHARFGGGIL